MLHLYLHWYFPFVRCSLSFELFKSHSLWQEIELPACSHRQNNTLNLWALHKNFFWIFSVTSWRPKSTLPSVFGVAFPTFKQTKCQTQKAEFHRKEQLLVYSLVFGGKHFYSNVPSVTTLRKSTPSKQSSVKSLYQCDRL